MRGGGKGRVNKRPADHRLGSAIERLSERATTEDCARRAQQITSTQGPLKPPTDTSWRRSVGVSVRLCGVCHLHSRLSSSVVVFVILCNRHQYAETTQTSTTEYRKHRSLILLIVFTALSDSYQGNQGNATT